ncbi:MAG TPA: hypothetical protein VE219_02155 [Candidatus Sulfotelmatobacter sp.]|nr:hypothetical protein [Candidatus Sulfotelmatobacter sp.]
MAVHLTEPVIVDGHHNGTENMRRDLELLNSVLRGEAQIAARIYGFSPPCLSIGRLQPWDDVDAERCSRDGIDIVRRPTGGRAVLHEDEVTYAIACRVDDSRFGGDVAASCRRIHGLIARALEGLCIQVMQASPRVRGEQRRHAAVPDCFANAAAHELVDIWGRKIVGSAQIRRANALLQHGSIPFEPPRTWLYMRRGAGDGVDPSRSAPGLNSLLQRKAGWSEVASALEGAYNDFETADTG